LASLYNIIGLNANITNIKCDTLVVDKCVMNSINKVFVGSGTIGSYTLLNVGAITVDFVEYSVYSKKYAISTICHTREGLGMFIWDSSPTDLNIGQIINFYNPAVNSSALTIDGIYGNGADQKFLLNGYAGSTFNSLGVASGTTCQIIYIGNNTWIAKMTYPPSDQPTGTDTTNATNNTYINISFPTFPTNSLI
jgi:hypothetical protein